MQTRLWLASAATVAVVATGVFRRRPHRVWPGASSAPSADTFPDADDLRTRNRQGRERGAREAPASRRPVQRRRATDRGRGRSAQHVVRDMDVKVHGRRRDAGPAGRRHARRPPANWREHTRRHRRGSQGCRAAGITGAYVSDVPSRFGAGKTGLQANDIIVSVDGETIRSARHLARVIAESPDGRALQVAYVRGTAKGTVTMTPEVRR